MRTFLHREFLEHVCPSTWRATRVLLMIVVAQEHGRRSAFCFYRSNRVVKRVFPWRVQHSKQRACLDPQQEGLVLILTYKVKKRLWPLLFTPNCRFMPSAAPERLAASGCRLPQIP